MRKTKLMAMLLAVIMLAGCMSGCGKSGGEVAELPYFINEMDVDVIDDLPDWTGSELDISLWYAPGNNSPATGKYKKDDKFQEELKRVSGITFSEKYSFDNGGESCDAKIAQMVASKNWPHVGMGVESNVATMLLDEGMIYDLTEYIPKYMPNYMKLYNNCPELQEETERKNYHDNQWYVLNGISKYASKYLDPEYTDEKYEKVITPSESRTWFWIRDDILKKIHPEAHTVKELQQIYLEKGEFTKNEICDFTIQSMDEFRKLLEDIDALGLKENGRKVWPFYTSEGTDNWSLLAEFMGIAGSGFGLGANYFAYYDVAEQKLMNPIKQDWFKQLMKFHNELYRDGLASEEAFIDTSAAFNQKKANGEYAILYGLAVPPSDETLKASGKNYSYRKVFVDVPIDHDRFIDVNSNPLGGSYGLVFFKDMLSESQLEQILRFIDFFYTDAGMKFAMYGPKKAGLYEEAEDGTFRYTDKKFEEAMLYGGDKQVLYDYGYESFPPIASFIGGSLDNYNKYHPQLMYKNVEIERVAADYINEFKISKVIPKPDYPRATDSWAVYGYTANVPGIKTMWDARQVIEDAFKFVLASKTEAEFEKAYQELIAVEERNGYDDKCFEEWNKYYAKINAPYMDDLKNWKPE